MKTASTFRAALFVGGIGGYSLNAGLDNPVTVEGRLFYEKPVDPALTPTFPVGHYVNSRVYIAEATPDMIGKRVIAHGAIDSITDPETSTYPVVKNAQIVIATSPTPTLTAPTNQEAGE